MKAVFAGLGYAFLLGLFAMAAGGAGHGLFAPTVVFVGPAALMQSFLALVWPFLVWPIIFWLVVHRARQAMIWLLIVELSSVVAALIYRLNSEPIDWKSPAVKQLWPEAAMFYLLFAVGQIVLWYGTLRTPKELREK